MNDRKTDTICVTEQVLPQVVLQAFDNYTREVQGTLLAVRKLIFKVRENDPEIGVLQEALRWGELSYLTDRPVTTGHP